MMAVEVGVAVEVGFEAAELAPDPVAPQPARARAAATSSVLSGSRDGGHGRRGVCWSGPPQPAPARLRVTTSGVHAATSALCAARHSAQRRRASYDARHRHAHRRHARRLAMPPRRPPPLDPAAPPPPSAPPPSRRALSGAGRRRCASATRSRAPARGPAGAQVTQEPNYMLWAEQVERRRRPQREGQAARSSWSATTTAAKPRPCVRTYEKLMGSDKVDLILPPWGTGANFAVAPLANRYGYPMLAPTATGAQAARHEAARTSSRCCSSPTR